MYSGGCAPARWGRNERSFAVSAQDGAAVLHRRLCELAHLQVAVVGAKGGSDYGRANRRAARLGVRKPRNRYGEQVATDLLHVLLGQIRIGEVHAERSVDLDIDEAGTDDAVLGIDDLHVTRTIQNPPRRHTPRLSSHGCRNRTAGPGSCRVDPKVARLDLPVTTA